MSLKTKNCQAIFNILSVGVLSIINFISIPIFTRLLGVNQFGEYTIYYTWVTFFACSISLQIESTLGVARHNFGEESFKKYASSVTLLSIICAICIAITVITLNSHVYKFISNTNYLVLMLVNASGIAMVNLTANYLIFDKKAEIRFLLNSSISVLSTVASIYLILYANTEKYISRGIGGAISYAIISVICIILVIKSGRTFFNAKYWKFAIMTGAPVILHMLSQNILNQSNKIMMDYIGLSKTEIGIFGFICSLTAIVNVLLSALNTTWVPYLYDELHKGNTEKIKSMTGNYIFLFTSVCVCFILTSAELCKLFAPGEFWGSISYIPFFAISSYFIFMYQFPVNVEFFNKKTISIAICTVIASLISIVLNYTLIYKFNVLGAVIGVILSNAVLFVIHYISTEFMINVECLYNKDKFIIGFLCIIMSIIGYYLLKDFVYLRWIISIIIASTAVTRIIKNKSIF